jgi:hypothetical protein
VFPDDCAAWENGFVTPANCFAGGPGKKQLAARAEDVAKNGRNWRKIVI